MATNPDNLRLLFQSQIPPKPPTSSNMSTVTKAEDTPLYVSAFEGLKYAYSLGKSNVV